MIRMELDYEQMGRMLIALGFCKGEDGYHDINDLWGDEWIFIHNDRLQDKFIEIIEYITED